MILKSKSGQILVEYILLLFISVSCATLLVRELIGRNLDAGQQGIIIKNWSRILSGIGSDLPDCHKQTSYNNPNCPN